MDFDETRPDLPLLPADPVARSRAGAAAQLIACDIHPINNLLVLRYLRDRLGRDQPVVDAWAQHWITKGFCSLEAYTL